MIVLQEEDEWHELLSKIDGIDLEDPLYPIPGAEESNDEKASSHLAIKEIEDLKELNESIQKQISMQVEGVSMIVGNIEDLIEKSTEQANEAQKEYHSERFKAFPHINSPARLIKAIIRKRPE